MADNTFGGRLIFDIEAMSIYTDNKQEQMFKQMQAELPDLDEKEKEQLQNFCGWYSLTNDIRFTFDGKEKAALKKFKVNWECRQQMSARELLDFWIKLPYIIRGAWVGVINEEQMPFEVDPAQLPTEALTPDQKAEAAMPDSPLP